jgi:hypothetical protein
MRAHGKKYMMTRWLIYAAAGSSYLRENQKESSQGFSSFPLSLRPFATEFDDPRAGGHVLIIPLQWN